MGADHPDRRGGWGTLSRLLRTFLRPYAGRVALVVLLLAIQAGGNLYLPNLNASIINKGIVDGDSAYIWRAGGVMLGIVFVLGVISVVTVYWASRVAMGVGADLRAAIYRRVQAFSAKEMNRFGIASLITRNVNDVQQIQIFLQMTLTLLVIAVIMSIGAVVLAVREGPALSLLLVVTLPVMALFIAGLLVALVPLLRTVQVKIDRINQVLREQITGIRVIRAFGRTGAEQERFADANDSITGTALRANRILAATMPVLLVISNLSSVGVIWFGARLVSEGSLSIGNMTAFLIYILQILLYTGIAVTVIVLIPRAVASAERVDQVLTAEPAVAEPAKPVRPAEVTGTVEFQNVTFGYAGSERPVLSELTFTFRPGQTSAIIGGTGSGKTTLLNLIPRFFDVTGGTVLVHGTDVREQAAEPLWATMGLVPQNAFLFAGTVASNLRFGKPDATDEELWRALGIAQAGDFVASMPGELEAAVSQGGRNLSGGQRQRLSIARAVVRQPSLYLFDDCFSALDAATDARLRAALLEEVRDASVVIVAQRVSTIMQADQIIVLDAGKVAGIGTHQQLLAGCAPYQEIVFSQLGEEAAA